jgi:hypothetical protein
MFPTFGPDVSGAAFNGTLVDAQQALPPQNVTASVNGSGIDFNNQTGQCFATQEIGTLSGTSPSLTGQIQQSPDNSTWSNVSGGAFTAVSTSNNFQFIAFTRSQRYLRYIVTAGGTIMTGNTSSVIAQANQ